MEVDWFWTFEQELDSLHATFKEQTTNNAKLKKMKVIQNFPLRTPMKILLKY